MAEFTTTQRGACSLLYNGYSYIHAVEIAVAQLKLIQAGAHPPVCSHAAVEKDKRIEELVPYVRLPS